MPQKKLYRFRKPLDRTCYQVQFKHIPGKWYNTRSTDISGAVLFAEARIKQDLEVHEDKTLRQFASAFFTEADPQKYRLRLDKRGTKYSPFFFEQNQRHLDNYILPRFGDYLIDSLSDVAIEDWLLELKSVKTGEDLSNDTKNKILVCFRIVLREAVRSKMISSNPADRVQMLPENNARRKPINKGELAVLFPNKDEDLIKVWGNLFWACYFLVMRDTGFRPGEVAALSTKNWIKQFHGLYTKNSIMQATRQLQHSIKTSNKGQSYKIGILTEQTERLLAQREQQIEPEEYFFLLDGRFLRPEVSNKHFKAVLRKQGIELDGRTQYSLRHSFETDLAGAVENKVLLELMAHTSYRAEYDHRTPEDLLRQLQPVRKILEDRENH